MDFHQQDIRHFLQESIPTRFKQLSPPAFGDFIRYLFEIDGYDPLPVSKSMQHEGLVLVKKEDIRLIIMPLRKNPEDILQADIITKAIQARELYATDQVWIVTTSSFSKESIQLAEESDIELWDWDALYGALCQLFFEGHNHLEYREAHPVSQIKEDRISELKLKVKWQAAAGVGVEWYNLGLTITNPSDRNIYLHLELPALIDTKKNQIMADQWVDGEFVSGLIYAGASIRTNALFSAEKLGDRPPGGRIVLTCHERLEIPFTYHLQARIQGQACYIVTYCYSIQSPEYLIMTAYRDEVLSRSTLGRGFIDLYYFLSSRLVKWAAQSSSVDLSLRKMSAIILPPIIKKINRKIKDASNN